MRASLDWDKRMRDDAFVFFLLFHLRNFTGKKSQLHKATVSCF